MLIIPGHERHSRIFRQETDNVNIVLHIPHALRQRHRIAGPIGKRGLRAVDHEHIFILRGNVQGGQGAGFERVDEMPCHCQESGVVEATILHCLGDVFVLGESAEGGEVGGLAVIVPGDEFDEIRLELEEREPAVEPDAAVLRIEPVEGGGEPFEEPGGQTRHPGFVVALGLVVLALVREGGVDLAFLEDGRGRVQPGEDPRADVGGGDVWGRGGNGAGHEHNRGADLVDHVGLPVEGRGSRGEGGQEDLAVDPELGRVVHVGVGDVGHDVRVGQAGGVVGHEELEVFGGGVRVELLQPGLHLHGVVLRAAVVDREGVDASILRKGNVVEVAIVGGLCHDHVVCEDEGVAVVARAGVQLVVVGVVLMVLVGDG